MPTRTAPAYLIAVLIRSLTTILIVASSFILVTGQTPEAKKVDADKTVMTSGIEKTRDLAFRSGVDVMFLIRELAKDMDLNVLFDTESRLNNRKLLIELKN